MMNSTKQAAPTVFLSYSHVDKRVARCIVRRLTAHGIRAWIDERELRVGATLTASIREQIQRSNVVLVVISKHSGISKWVGLEVDFAQAEGKTIVPFFIDATDKPERFQDMLGVEATSPQGFADAVQGFIRDLFLSFDQPVPPIDPTILRDGLRNLASEEPDLAPLISGCLDSEGLHRETMDTVYKGPFYPLDDALNSLFDLMPITSMAYHAASGFRFAGAGVRALSLWIAATGDGELPLVNAVGSPLEPSLIMTAIKLLGACNPPNNHALYNFIHHNATQLDQEQRHSVLRLVTWPLRADTGRLADVLGWVAIENFPNVPEIQQMWCRWIQAGCFDGKPSTPTTLADYLADASRGGLQGWESINDALRSYVRSCLRSGDKQKVVTAADHIRAVADKGAPVLQSLLREAEGVSGAYEWNQWEQRDPETAERMKWYVMEVAKEARGDKNWLRAWNTADEMVASEKQRRAKAGE